MSDERIPKNKTAEDKSSRQTISGAWKDSTNKALKVLENTETVIGHPRQIVDAGLLGTCVLFLAAMLGVPQKQFDTPLTIASVAFVVAIAFIACGYLNSFLKTKPVPGYLVLEAILTGASVAEALGELIFTVGMFAIVAHLSLLALKAFIAAVILAFGGLPFLALIGLMIYAWHKSQKEKQQQKVKEEVVTPAVVKPNTHRSPPTSKASTLISTLVIALGLSGPLIGLLIYAMHKFQSRKPISDKQ